MTGRPRPFHGGDEGVHDGVEALMAEDEILGEGLEPQDRMDAAGQPRPQLLERRHLADLVAEVDQQDRDVRVPQHPAGQAAAGGGARLQHGVHARRAAEESGQLPERPAEEDGRRHVPRPHGRVEAFREELLERGGGERARTEQRVTVVVQDRHRGEVERHRAGALRTSRSDAALRSPRTPY
jgi:hypothetical protein